MPADATLDTLLRQLLRSPGDAALAGKVGDCLLDTGHPAATWWPGLVVGLAPTSRGGPYPKLRPVAYHLDTEVTDSLRWPGPHFGRADEASCPGIADLCHRLDRLAAEDAAALAAERARAEAEATDERRWDEEMFAPR